MGRLTGVGRPTVPSRTTGFDVEVVRGTAAELHEWEPPSKLRAARWCQVVAPALVLGSAQSSDSVDVDACAAHGIDVVRRRSGGGAVLMIPGEIDWLDVVVPVGDPLWDADVGRSMWWLGEVWADALRASGSLDVEVYTGPLRRTPWSPVVCFDGLGSGEVVVAGAKAVGISQRRTRGWSRLQVAVHRRWRHELLTELLVAPVPQAGSGPAQLKTPYCLPDNVAGEVISRVEASLADR